MRGEASWQTSITSTHTRTHAKTHARKHSCQQAVCHVGLQIDHEPSARYIRCITLGYLSRETRNILIFITALFNR